ncbi:MAG: translation elongation factor Ts [Zetaproteobacteria bacterium CG2_30_46_52]|nr:MAG: translation elongation factor Ts [Zetaproteobacteria bacterium CG2_30_46_52]
MAITAADVKKLREATGAGMMDCKKALGEVDGNFDAAVDYLRTKGLAAASKKAGRVAAEGIVATKSQGNVAVILELNAETDFVSKNDQFVAFADNVNAFILDKRPADVDALLAMPFDGDLTVEQSLSQLIAKIGENMSIRRFQVLECDGVVANYIHGAGKIGVLVAVQGQSNDALADIARGVAMHVAAANPMFVSRDQVTPDVIERERAVLTERALESGKPKEIVDKIVAGQMQKFYSENCLLDQAFVMDTDKIVSKAVSDVQAGAKVVGVVRFALGEGIEKVVSDFAAEVAAQING